jgi:hypothetical protein
LAAKIGIITESGIKRQESRKIILAGDPTIEDFNGMPFLAS